MPLIRVLQAVAGLDFSWSPGQEVEVSDEQAAVWADGYRAELIETTDAPPAEVRARRTTKREGA